MSDLIRRQAVIDALKVAYWDKDIQSAKDDPCIVDAMTDWAIRQVKNLPSANKSGHWVMNPSEVAGDGYYICSNCNNDVYDATDFCPNCGSYNRGESNG